ncbi:TatD family hydrolase [Fulvivirga sediminis]|uniref:TatD family hydrolase n=1 Tax=Fulvivirga sediminis TaxID=2803949 RepID=A0A937FAR3_9BACT|nr:TatD family hydrolase [Fulvivirga sediminis]MBL3657148.1 TatD family hydrolase [Fulvivirga sediminis]
MNDSIFTSEHYLDFHTHSMRHVDEEDVMEIVSIHPGKDREKKYYTVGMHPWWTERPIDELQKQELKQWLRDERCLAMGEMGLDNLKGPDMTKQMDILRSQLALAQELNKAVIIHCVRAYDQLIHIKKEFPKIKKWCVHGYGRHAILAQQLIDQGFYLSIMPTVKPERYESLFHELPHGKLFLETDSMPNVSIKNVYSQLSKITGIDEIDLCRQMNSNAKEFFSK